MLNEIVLTEEALGKLQVGYKDRIDFDERAIMSARLPLKDNLGNIRGSVEVKLRDFQYIGSGRTSVEYEVLWIDRG